MSLGDCGDVVDACRDPTLVDYRTFDHCWGHRRPIDAFLPSDCAIACGTRADSAGTGAELGTI